MYKENQGLRKRDIPRRLVTTIFRDIRGRCLGLTMTDVGRRTGSTV
jgi:hypothetical protein